MVKLHDLRGYWPAPQVAVPHPAVTELVAVADALVRATDGMTEDLRSGVLSWPPEALAKVEALVPRARAACEAAQPLADAHFASPPHSHGERD